MARQALTHVAALALLLGAATAAHGQEPAPVQIEAAELAEGGPLVLEYAWRFHPGDDPRWAAPAFDDSGWELVEPLLPPRGRPRGGSRLSGVWSERSAPLAPGDTLLFASDGFAEQLDSADNPLGDERLVEVFRASAGAPASELVERFLARVAAWRGGREQGDDVTCVVVRVTG